MNTLTENMANGFLSNFINENLMAPRAESPLGFHRFSPIAPYEVFRSVSPVGASRGNSPLSFLDLVITLKKATKDVFLALGRQYYLGVDKEFFSATVKLLRDEECLEYLMDWINEANESTEQKDLSLTLSETDFKNLPTILTELRSLRHLTITNSPTIEQVNLTGWKYLNKLTIVNCPNFQELLGVDHNRKFDLDLEKMYL